jgi:lactoylglutathione lyase
MSAIKLLNGSLTQLTLACLTVACAGTALAQESNKKEFSKPVIDIGMVARDVEKSARFYTDAIGFTEVQGFSVTADLGRKIGLIDSHPVTVRMFVLAQGDLATRVKLMSFPDAPGKPADQSFIHSTYGIRYLTLYVASADRALDRLKRAGVKTLGETPLSIGKDTRLIVVRDPDGNFIELIGP